MPNLSLVIIYMGYTYMFAAFFWLFSCIIYPEYIILAYFKGVILYHYPPQRGELPSTICRKGGLSTKCQG